MEEILTADFKESWFWKQTLAERADDPHSEKRAKLRGAYLEMRNNVKPLVDAAHRDCPGLTVHDVSHLDALWLTASRVAGSEYPLTPAEGLVLGCSILLHDAGMAIAAYEGGIEEIRSRPEWCDSVKSALVRLYGEAAPAPEDAPLSVKTSADFTVLRRLHAAQAQVLATRAFKHPTEKTDMFLLDDQELRDAYGDTIGRVAHSHHWDIDRLPHELRQLMGAPTGFPDDWTVNAVKVAGILRCADAAHIDADRAPRMLFALNRPTGISLEHWRFQNKVLQSTTRGDKMLFSSRKPFGRDEAKSWWLGFDVIQMIDRELATTSDLLERLDLPRFEISGVVGAESPRLLAKHIETHGWLPVNVKVQVSDPAHLARTLGGRNLYGDTPFAPVRELLTNAVDSVRARRVEEEREESWGIVRVIIERASEADGTFWVHFDDTGLGMSEPVLTGGLLDFGLSHWSSAGFQDEYPGLLARGFKPTGKFGIGFFSIFLLGNQVKVCSRPFKGASSDTKALEFDSLDDRPVLRDALDGEVPRDFVTRVSVKISADKKSELDFFHPDSRATEHFTLHLDEPQPKNIREYIQKLVATLNVRVEFLDKCNGSVHVHKPNWHEQPPADIVRDLAPHLNIGEGLARKIGAVFQPVMERGKIVGLAAVPSISSLVRLGQYVSVDGFTYRRAEEIRRTEHRKFLRYIGILFGDTEDARRETASPNVHDVDFAAWATHQAATISKLNFSALDGLGVAHDVLKGGGDPQTLPFAFAREGFLSSSETAERLSTMKRVVMPASLGYDAKVDGIHDLPARYFTHPLRENVIISCPWPVRIGSIDRRGIEDLKKSNQGRAIQASDIEGGLQLGGWEA